MKDGESDIIVNNNSEELEIEALVVRYQGGDEEAFNALASKFKKQIGRLAFKFAQTQHTLEQCDLENEGLLALYKLAKEYEPGQSTYKFSVLAYITIKQEMNKVMVDELVATGTKRYRAKALVGAKKYLEKAMQLKGGTLTHLEKLESLMDRERKQYRNKLNSEYDIEQTNRSEAENAGLSKEIALPTVRKERKLYLNAKYVLQDIDTYLSANNELDDALPSDTPTMQELMEDTVFKKLVERKLRDLDDICKEIVILKCTNCSNKEIQIKLSISATELERIEYKIKKALLDDEEIRSNRRYAQRKYKWTRNEKNKSKYRKTRYNKEDLTYLTMLQSSFSQDAEKVILSYAPKFNRLKMFYLVGEHIGRKVINMPKEEEGEIPENAMYRYLEKLTSLYSADYKKSTEYTKYIIPMVEKEDDLPMESYIFFASLLSSYLEDDSNGKNLKQIMQSKIFIASDYWGWRAKMSRHLHVLMDKCFEYICNEALADYNTKKINAQHKAAWKKRKVEELDETYELASEYVKVKTINMETDLSFEHHDYYDYKEKIAFYKCFNVLLDITMFALSKNKVFYIDDNDVKLQEILTKLELNPTGKVTITSLENHLRNIITSYHNGSEDAESHIFDIITLHKTKCMKVGRPEIKKLITEMENIVDERMQEIALYNAENPASRWMERYRQDPVLSRIINGIESTENEYREKLEKMKNEQLHQLEVQAYETRMTDLINDYQNGNDGSIEAIFVFITQRKQRCVELETSALNFLIEKLENIINDHNE